MKKTSKIIIAFVVALAIASTVLVVAIFKKENSDAKAPSVLYTLQPTTISATPSVTDSWVDINAIASDLETDTDAAVTLSTLPGIVSTNAQGVVYVYVDQNGNIVDPNNLSGSVVGSIPVGESMEGASFADASNAQEIYVTNFEIDSNGNVVKYFGDSDTVMVPKEINGKQVKGVADGCFKDSTVSSIYFSGPIRSVGNSAFENCQYLNTIIFSNNTDEISVGTNAFKGCVALGSVKLPKVTTMGNSVFDGCTSLKTVEFAEGTTQIGAYTFANCIALTKVVVPKTVEDMGQNMFAYCNKPNITIVTPDGSTAEDYAINNGISYRTP